MKYSIERSKRFYHLKKYEQVITELEGTGIEPSENLELAYYLGLALTHLERYDEALIYLEQVVSSRENFLHVTQCRMILGYIYSETGRYQLAEFEFRKTLRGGVRSHQVYASLGHVYYQMRRIEDSITALKKALSMVENYPSALNSLGYIYAEENIDSIKAIQLCKRAVTIKPKNPSYLDSLGWAHFKAGKLQEARGFLRRALDILPGNKQIAQHLKIVMESLV
ncbi:MAG: tetratricopeptide repeat protein [Spirochaetales bacterium]|nr:tetratricopeptide repeat protein [Spirochaetales bacterium]